MLYVNPQANAVFRDRALSPGASARETQALQEFERLFLFQMLKEMRSTVPEGGLLDAGSRQDRFEEMLDDFLAGEMAASGQFGIARQMAAELDARNARANPAGPARASGIPLNAPKAGIPVAPPAVTGIPLPDPAPGIAADRGTAGIPLARANAAYRNAGIVD
jgi:flagellar protein FlgJ